MIELETYKGNELAEYMEYQQRRDAPCPVPYTHPPSEVSPYQSLHTLDRTISAAAPPILKLTGLASVVALAVSAVGAGISSTVAFVAANGTIIGGAACVAVVAILAACGRGGSDGVEKANAQQQSGNISVTVNVAGQSVNNGK